MGIALYLYIALGNMAILTLLILPIHEHAISFHFMYLFLSFNNALQFSVYRSFTSFVKLIARYFILFDRNCKRIFFLSFFSYVSVLAYKKAVDFCTLVLYPATLLYLFTDSNRFLVESLWFSVYKIMPSEKKWHFYFFLPNLDTCYFFLLPYWSGWGFQIYVE